MTRPKRMHSTPQEAIGSLDSACGKPRALRQMTRAGLEECPRESLGSNKKWQTIALFRDRFLRHLVRRANAAHKRAGSDQQL
jgi:hypothetical protein